MRRKSPKKIEREAALARQRWKRALNRRRKKSDADRVKQHGFTVARQRINRAGIPGPVAVRITPPDIFSFKANYEETVGCLRAFKKVALAPKKRGVPPPLHIDLAPIKKLSVAAALVLAAEIDRWRLINRVPLKPKNVRDWHEPVRNMLFEIGFFDLLGVEPPRECFREALPEEVSVLPLMSCDELDTEKIACMQDRLFKAAQFFQQEPLIYGAMVEAAGNSLEHAYPSGHDYEFQPFGRQWWATGSWAPAKDEVRFLVYDQGVGISATLQSWSLWEQVRERISTAVGGISETAGGLASTILKEHSSLIEAALETSRSSRPAGQGRGNGLSDIISPINELDGGKLRILSGRGEVIYRSGGRTEKKERSLHLGGTLIEWTIPIPNRR